MQCPFYSSSWTRFGEQRKGGIYIGTRVIYDRSTLLALSNSQLAKTPPTKMMYVAGVTKASGQDHGHSSLHPSAASSYRRAADIKREEEAKKKTCKFFVTAGFSATANVSFFFADNPYAVLNNDDDDMFDMED